jgi:hypothetical protein
VNMDEISDDGCQQLIGQIKVEGIQFDKSGRILESFRFTDKNEHQWSVPTNIENLLEIATGPANDFIRVGKVYFVDVQVCGSGGYPSLISMYDASVSFGVSAQ